jgi:glycosyltransferase 2 family protein
MGAQAPSAGHGVRWLALVRAVGYVACVGIVVLVGVAAARDLPDREFDWRLLVLAAPVAVAWWLLLARTWSLIVRGRWVRAEVAIWLRTQVLRFLPGGIWAPASRAAVTPGRATHRLWVVSAENVASLCAALAVGGLALALAGSPLWLPLVAAALVPLAVARVAPRRLAAGLAARVTANGLIGFACYGVCAALAQAAVSGADRPLAVAGAAAIAWAAGLVVVFAPSGLGVRELVYVALLHRDLGRDDLVAGALTLRVVTVVAELGVLLVLGRPREARRGPAAATLDGADA